MTKFILYKDGPEHEEIELSKARKDCVVFLWYVTL